MKDIQTFHRVIIALSVGLLVCVRALAGRANPLPVAWGRREFPEAAKPPSAREARTLGAESQKSSRRLFPRVKSLLPRSNRVRSDLRSHLAGRFR